MDVRPGKEGTSDCHSSGSCEVDASLAVVVRHGVQAMRADHRLVHFFPTDLRVHVPDEVLDVSTRAAIVEFLQLCVELFFLCIGSSFVGAVHIEDSVVVEPAFYSQQTQLVADRLPLDHTTLHPAQHYKAGTQLIGCAAALVVL